MEMEYLKTNDDIRFVRDVVISARVLDKAEQDIRTTKPIFSQGMDEIKKRFGLTLWHSVDNDVYYWEFKDKKHSVNYPNRNIALHSLLVEDIQWLD